MYVERDLVPERLQFAWFEKIALLLLAAHLESNGWPDVRLSVPRQSLKVPGLRAGTDWARAFKAVQERGVAFGKGEGAARQDAYRNVVVGPEERAGLADALPGHLRSAVAGDKEYRYDGIWHDDGGRIDLVAWAGERVLLVEAKGITKSKDSINWNQAACDTLAVVDRVVGRDELPDARRGLLLPDDRGVAPTGSGFVATLLRVWPLDRVPDHTNPVFLVTADGTITEHTVASLS